MHIYLLTDSFILQILLKHFVNSNMFYSVNNKHWNCDGNRKQYRVWVCSGKNIRLRRDFFFGILGEY